MVHLQGFIREARQVPVRFVVKSSPGALVAVTQVGGDPIEPSRPSPCPSHTSRRHSWSPCHRWRRRCRVSVMPVSPPRAPRTRRRAHPLRRRTRGRRRRCRRRDPRARRGRRYAGHQGDHLRPIVEDRRGQGLVRLRPPAPTRRAPALRRAGPRRLARGHPGRGETGAGRRAMRSKRHRVRRSERAAARHGRLGRQRRPRPPR